MIENPTPLKVVHEDIEKIVWLFTLSMIPCQLFYFIAFFQVTIIYLQICYKLKNLANKISLEERRTKKILEKTGKLLDMLDKVSKLISSQSLHLITLSLLYLIILVFLAIDFLSSSSLNHWASYIFFISGAIYFGSILWILNKQSEDIKQSLVRIKHLILNLVISNDFAKINGNHHTEAYARILLITKLDEFQGFDIGGYLILGKPLLIVILCRFATFIVVLFEFWNSVGKIW